MNQLIESLNQHYGNGRTGIEFSFVQNSENADQGEIWIQRGPERTNPDKSRTGKNFAPIRLSVDLATLNGIGNQQTVMNLRGKLITSEVEYKHGTVNVDDRVKGFDSKDWHKRTAFDVAHRIITNSLEENEGMLDRKDFGTRFNYLTDPYGSVGTSMSFKQMRQVGDNRLNAIANTVSIRSPFAVNKDQRKQDKDFGDHLHNIAQKTGFISGTAGIISASSTPRSEATMAPIRGLEGMHNNVVQTTHFGYAAAHQDPKTGQWVGPIDTGRFMNSDSQSYTVGYHSSNVDKVFGKESKRASLTQRLQYMPDASNRTNLERHQSAGRERMNEIVVVAREGDMAGAGGSIASTSMMGLKVYDHETRKRAALPRQFKLTDIEFLGRAEGGRFSQAGGAIARDNDLTTPGSSDGRKVRVDRTGLEGIELTQRNRAKPTLDANGKLAIVKDQKGNNVMENATEFRLSFGYDKDTARMVSEFGIEIDGKKYNHQSQAELEQIFSPEVVTAKQNGKWRSGVTKEQKELHEKFTRISDKVVEAIQSKNLGVSVVMAPNQGGTTSGRTVIEWGQRRKIDVGAEKGGSGKETVRGNYLPDNPEVGGEVEKSLPAVQQYLAMLAHGNRKLERMVYATDRKGNFEASAPGLDVNEVDSATGLYKNRVMRPMLGAQMEETQSRFRREFDRQRRAVSGRISQLDALTDVSQVAAGQKVNIAAGTYSGRDAYVEHQGKRSVTSVDPTTGKTVTNFVDDSDYTTVRLTKTKAKTKMVPATKMDMKAGSPTFGTMVPVLDKNGKPRMVSVPDGTEEVFDRYESFQTKNVPGGNSALSPIYTDDDVAKIVPGYSAGTNDVGAARRMLVDQSKRTRDSLNAADQLKEDTTPFGRWMQNRDRLRAENINSEFLERYVGPVSKLMSIAEQKSDQLFQLETLVGTFFTSDKRFARAREVIRNAFGANDSDSEKIWMAAQNDPAKLGQVMREVLEVAPRTYTKGEHPEFRFRGNAAFEAAGLYEPQEREMIDPVTGLKTMSKTWDLENDDTGRVTLARSTLGISPEYTGLGRMTSEMMRMVYKTMPQMYEDIAAEQKDRAHLIQALTPELAKNKIAIDPSDVSRKLAVPTDDMEDDERYEELMQSWNTMKTAHGLPGSSAIVLPALPGEDKGYSVPNPEVYVGQERSAIGRAYVNLLEKSQGGYTVGEVVGARQIYESELETFFQQQETVKNALSINGGLMTGFSRYVMDENVADNEIVIGDDTVSLFAEQASRMAGSNVSKEDIIAAINSNEGMYGLSPRMPEVTEYMMPFRFRYDEKNKSLPRVNKYFALTYMGDNDADPIMMAIMGAFDVDKTTGKATYRNFRQVKEEHEKLPSGYSIALSRLQSGSNQAAFSKNFRESREVAQKMLDYEIDNNLLVRKDEQGRDDYSLHNRMEAARSSGGVEYGDLIDQYTMEGLIRGRTIRDKGGNIVSHAGSNLKIESMTVETGGRFVGGKVVGGKGQNIEKDRQEDLEKGAPTKLVNQLTKITQHVIGAKRMAEFKQDEEKIYKGMGIFTYLKSMTTFFDDKHAQMVENALPDSEITNLANYAQSKDKSKGGLGQFTSKASLAREGIIMQYQEAIDMVRSDPAMEEASKNFFTADVSDWITKEQDIRKTAVMSMLDSTNLHAHTVAAMLGDSEDRIRNIYHAVNTYREGRYKPAGSKEAQNASSALTDIINYSTTSENSMWHRAMRGSVLINTQDRLNSGWYEENRTVEQRRQLQRAYGEFKAKYKGRDVDEAVAIGSLRRMRDTAFAITSAAKSFMSGVLENQGYDMGAARDTLLKTIRKTLGGKNIENLSLEPGPADAKEKSDASVVNTPWIHADPRKNGTSGIHSSYAIAPGRMTDTQATPILRMLGAKKKPGEEFTNEELERLPISASQIAYLADPNGDEKAIAKNTMGSSRGIENEASVHSSGIGLINSIISGMYKRDKAGMVLGGDGVGDIGRGMFTVAAAGFERGKVLEEAVFSEAKARGEDTKTTIGYRSKGHVYSEFFNAQKDASGNYAGAGTIAYEPDLLVPSYDSSGNIAGWQIQDIKTTRTNATDGTFGTPDDWAIKEEGQWNEGEMPGGYVTQQAFYTQAINEFSSNVREHVNSLGGSLKDSSGRSLSVGQYLEGVHAGTINIKGDQRMVTDLAKQYMGMKKWFTSSDNGLSDDAARGMVESIVKTGVTAGGLKFNVTRTVNGKTEFERDGNNNLLLRDYDNMYGASSGFAKLRPASGSPLDKDNLEAGRNLTLGIRKAASENRLLRAAKNLPQFVAATKEASERWNLQRAALNEEIIKKPGALKGSAKSMDVKEAGALSRELAATMPYLRTFNADRGYKKNGFITEEGMVAAESEFAKYGILDINSTDKLSEITGKKYDKPDEKMDARIEFRKLMGAAARNKAVTLNPRASEYHDISDKEYQENNALLAQFFGGTNREAALKGIEKAGILNAGDIAANFKMAAGPGGTSVLVDSAADTARQMYALLEKKFGGSRGAMMRPGRVLVDPRAMHANDLEQDKSIQGSFIGKVRSLAAAILTTPTGKEGFVASHSINQGLARIVDDEGNTITAGGEPSTRATVESLMEDVRSLGGRLMEREDYSNITIPDIGAANPIAGTASHSQIEQSREWMATALAAVNPGLGEQIKSADATELPRLYQQAFEAIGTEEEYYSRVGRFTVEGTPTQDYRMAINQYNAAVESISGHEAVSFLGNVPDPRAAQYIPPKMDEAGRPIARPERMTISAPTASPSVSSSGPAPSGPAPTPPPSSPPPSSPPSGAATGSAPAPAPAAAGGPKAPKPPKIVDSRGVINMGELQKNLPSIHDALTAEERAVIEKNRQHHSKAGGPKLAKKERAIHDDIAKRIGAARAAAAAAPAPAAPAGAAATPGAAPTPGPTVHSSPGSTSPTAPTTPGGGGGTVHSSPGSGSLAAPRGSIAAGGFGDDIPRWGVTSPTVVMDYLSRMQKNTVTDPTTGVVTTTYSTGVDDTYIHQKLTSGEIGTTEGNMLQRLSDVFKSLSTGGVTKVSKTDLDYARRSLLTLTSEVTAQSGWGASEKDVLQNEILRVAGILQDDGRANTREGIKLANATTAAAVVTAAAGAAAAGAPAPGGPAGIPAAPTMMVRGKKADGSNLDITTTNKDIEEAAEKFKKLRGNNPKINTDNIYNGLRRELVGKEGIVNYNNERLNPEGAGRANFHARVGWDVRNADAIVSDAATYEGVVKKLHGERETTQNRIKEAKQLASNIEAAFTGTGLKFEDHPEAQRALEAIKISIADAEASLTDAGLHGSVERQVATRRATVATDVRSQNYGYAQTVQAVQTELASGAIANPGGMTNAQYIHQEAERRVAAGTGHAGFTPEQRESALHEEYQKARKEIEKGTINIKDFFKGITDFTAGLRKSTDGWVHTLSTDGQKEVHGFLTAVNQAADQLDAFAGMSIADRNNPNQAGQMFRGLIDRRKELQGQIDIVSQDATLDEKKRGEIIDKAQAAVAHIDKLLTTRGPEGVVDAAEQDMGRGNVQRMLREQGLEAERPDRNSAKWPGFSLMGAHAAYQIFMAAKTGFNPMMEASKFFEESHAARNAIVSRVNDEGFKSDTGSGRGDEAKKSWLYRRGRESTRMGDFLASAHDNGAFSAISDIIDPVRGAGVALVPLYETVNAWGNSNRNAGGFLASMNTRGIDMRNAAAAASAAGKGNIGTALGGAAGGLLSAVAGNPGGALVIGGMVATAIASGVANYSTAANDQRGLALVNQIARNEGASASFNASPWSYMAAGLNRPGEFFTNIYSRAGQAANRIGGGPELSNGTETRAYLEYASLAGQWRDYSKALGVDSGSQLEAQSLALMVGGGVRRADSSYAGMEMRLIRAQSTGETAAGALSMGQQMAAATGEKNFRAAERYLQNVPVDMNDPVVRERVNALQQDVNNTQKRYDNAIALSKTQEDAAKMGFGGQDMGGAFVSSSIEIYQAEQALQEAKDRYEAETIKPEWNAKKSTAFISNFEKVGNPEELDKASVQAGISAPGEIKQKLMSLIEGAAQDTKGPREFTAREAGIIASSVAGNKLFEMSMRGMNMSQAGFESLVNKLGPKDYFSYNGQMFSEITSSQREIGSQVASYGESVRSMRAQAGMSYNTNIDSYVGGVQFIRDNAGRAIGMDRNSVVANTYQNFGKTAMQRSAEMYGIDWMKSFGDPMETAKAIGLAPKEIQISPGDSWLASKIGKQNMSYLDEYQSQLVGDLQQQVGTLALQSKLSGIDTKDFSDNLKSLFKDSKYGEKLKDPVKFQNLATLIEMTANGGVIAKRANAMGFSTDMINNIAKGAETGLPLQLISKLGAGDGLAMSQALVYRMDELNKATGGKFGQFVNENGITPTVDVSTGAGIFERSMVGMKNPFTGKFVQSQSEITPAMVGASMNGMRKQLFGRSGAAYAANDAAMAGFKYTNPDNGKTEVIGGVAGLNLRSNQVNYQTQMASIAISREQLEYNRNNQLTWDFPVAETQNQISRAQQLGGVVQTDWMKQHGIGPLDYSGGTVKIDGMKEAVTYEGGQIGQAKFNLEMSQIEAKRGYQQSMARMGWQMQDMSREIGRSRIKGDWQREDFALQAEQMQFARSKQAYDFGYQAREMGISRQTYREDFAFQQRQRQLQFGWQMEDADINIRRSTGFERKQLIKQKERETISFNMESEQVAKQNNRQEDAFKREEEKFKKEVEHYQKSLKFEDEQFKRQQKRFEKQREWEEEDYLIKVGRANEEAGWAAEAYQRQLAKFAVEEDQLAKQKNNEEQMSKWRDEQHIKDMKDAEKMYELSKRSLENSAHSVEEQKKIQDDLVILNQRQQDAVNAVTNAFAKVDWVATAGAINQLLETLRKLGVVKEDFTGKDEKKKTGGDTPNNAFGGFVKGGKSVLIGELGPEILTVGKDGGAYILPNSAIPKDRSMSRAGTDKEVIHIHVMMDGDEIASYTADRANQLAARNRVRAFNG